MDPTVQGEVTGNKLFDILTGGTDALHPRFRLLRVDLSTRRDEISPSYAGDAYLVAASARQVIVGVEGSSSNVTVISFSATTLLPSWHLTLPSTGDVLDGYLWVPDGTAGLLRVDLHHRNVVRVVPTLRKGSDVTYVSAGGPYLYLSVDGDTQADNAIVRFDPIDGQTLVAFTTAPDAVTAAAHLLWFFPSIDSGNWHGVGAVRFPSLVPASRSHQGCGGINGSWGDVVTPTALWCQVYGEPVVCVSGVTGRALAVLRLPGDIPHPDGLGIAPRLIAVGDGTVVISTSTSAQPRYPGLALYRFDSHC